MNKRASEDFFVVVCKSLIFNVEIFWLGTAFAPLSCLSWCVKPPATSPQGFTSRAYYIMHTGGREEFRCNIRPCTFKSVKAV